MQFFTPGEKKTRPGVYMRIVNNGANARTQDVMPVQPQPPSGGDDPVVAGIVSVMDGVLSANGQALTLGAGSSEGGYTVVFGPTIAAAVLGETLVVTNPAGA